MESEADQKKIRTVFVSGLPYETTEEEIRQFFENCGEIEELKAPRYQDTGRLRGFAHVTFDSVEGQKEALKLNNESLGGRYLVIQPAKGENAKQTVRDYKGAEATNSVFVKNLPYDITEDDVGDAFRHCGAIANVRLVYNNQQGHFKGFGYIDFKIPDAAKAALKMNGKEVKGRKITVDLEYGAAKQGFRQKTEEEGNKKYNEDAKQILKKTIKKHNKKDKKDVQLAQKKLDKISKMRAEAKSQLV